MYSLVGQYEVKIDAKGRLRLPSDLLKQIPESSRREYVLNKGIDNGCLSLYPIEKWKEVSSKVDALNYFNEEHRQFQRFFYRAVVKVELDSSDRVLVPKRLQDEVKLKEDIVILAFGQNIEIWPKDLFNGKVDKAPENYSDMASRVMGGINL
jgi:MraZ protein